MKVLSLFDGMSCGRIALDKLDVDCEYYAAEIDKYAIKVSEANYPDIIRLGDVTKWQEWDIDWNFDLVLAGSPCQGFSFAGKQLAFDDPRSALFFTFVDILNHIKTVNPDVKFLLENVRMKKEFLQVINDQLGVEPILINSALVSAQNRQRYYWCNWNVEQPENKGILLKDVIDHAQTERDKSHCLDANYYKGSSWEQYKAKSRRQLVRPCEPREYNTDSLCHHAADATDIKGNESIKRVYAETGKSPTLTTMGGVHREPKVLCGAMRGRYIVDGKRAENTVDSTAGMTEQRLEIRKDGKTNCLTTVQKDNYVVEQSSYRKLTPLECERLQTVPDNYTNHVSNTQRYKMLGNGWTVDVIAHILKGIK